MWASLQPYSKKSIKESDLIALDWDDYVLDDIDLDAEIVAVEKDRKYWAKVDRLRKEKLRIGTNGSSAN